MKNLDVSTAQKAQVKLHALIKSATESLTSVIAHYDERIQKVNKAMQNAIAETPESLKILANDGWYLPFDVTPNIVLEASGLWQSGQEEKANQLLINFFDEEIEFIKRELLSRFPHRANPITEAIDAHQQKKFYLSIPVFFSQAEGVCEELTGKRFFSSKDGRPLTRSWAEEFNSDSILSLFTEPLKEIGVVRLNQRGRVPIGINRHDVLHGSSVDYGKEINSYKALSLLWYFGDAIYAMKQELRNS